MKRLFATLCIFCAGIFLLEAQTASKTGPYKSFQTSHSKKVYKKGEKILLQIKVECNEGFVCRATRLYASKSTVPKKLFTVKSKSFRIQPHRDPRYTTIQILPWKWEGKGKKEFSLQRVLPTDQLPAGDYMVSCQGIFQKEKKQYYRSTTFTFTVE